MDNRQHGLKNVAPKGFWAKVGKYARDFFGFSKEEKPKALKIMRPWQQGGGFGIGKPAWMRKRIEGVVPAQKKRSGLVPLTRRAMYDKEGRCLLVTFVPKKFRNRNKYSVNGGLA